MTTSEIKVTLETYKKTISDSYTLTVDSDLNGEFWSFLIDFKSPDFLRHLKFQLEKNGKIKASLWLSISKENHAVSLPSAPFGGIWIKEYVNSEALEGYIFGVLEYLKEIGVQSLQITQPPKPYVPQADLINNLFLKSGFELKGILSHQFFLGKKKIKKLVDTQSSKFQRKEIDFRIQVKSGPIQNFRFLDEIKAWNSMKGYEVGLNEKRLISQVSEFPEKYFLISIVKDEATIAHCLAVKLTPDSLYYFLSAIDPKSNVKSLGDTLVFSLFQLASKHKIEYIDLGSSESNQRINHSLMYFKSRFSNDISNKISWYRKIEK